LGLDLFPMFQQVEASERPVLPPGNGLTCCFHLLWRVVLMRF
jgi:hypothetical protein